MVERAALIDARTLLGMRDDGQRYELVEGVLRMMSPAGGRHGRVAHSLALILGTHVRGRQLGLVYAAETGFVLAWLTAGTRLVIVVDPSTRTLHAYRGSDRVVVLREGERLDAGDVVPGLTIAVAELFQG
jgi:Uma2 family endonuclease